MSPATARRTTARVVPVNCPVNCQGEALLMLSGDPAFPDTGTIFFNGSTWFAVALEADPEALRTHDESEQILDYLWWTANDLARDWALNHERLPVLVRAAVSHLGLSA